MSLKKYLQSDPRMLDAIREGIYAQTLVSELDEWLDGESCDFWENLGTESECFKYVLAEVRREVAGKYVNGAAYDGTALVYQIWMEWMKGKAFNIDFKDELECPSSLQYWTAKQIRKRGNRKVRLRSLGHEEKDKETRNLIQSEIEEYFTLGASCMEVYRENKSGIIQDLADSICGIYNWQKHRDTVIKAFASLYPYRWKTDTRRPLSYYVICELVKKHALPCGYQENS